jgi:outer membrane protein TolC
MWRSAVIAVLYAAAPASAEDDELRALVQQALEARPELAQANAALKAAKERVPQAQAWPEPMLSVGVQNDGFRKWQVGTMETSWVSFMASQTFPFPGKNDLRAEVAQSDVQLSELVAERVRLSTIAEVRRGYLALQLVRARRVLLEKLIALNTRLVEVARLRSESGAGSQAEVLRAQVELSRVGQRRFLLESEERQQVQSLNRLRPAAGHRPSDAGQTRHAAHAALRGGDARRLPRAQP